MPCLLPLIPASSAANDRVEASPVGAGARQAYKRAGALYTECPLGDRPLRDGDTEAETRRARDASAPRAGDRMGSPRSRTAPPPVIGCTARFESIRDRPRTGTLSPWRSPKLAHCESH